MSNQTDPIAIESSFHVRYAETDAMAVVHHAAYLVYFEEARSHYMRELGSDYANIERDGYRLPVTEVSLRYVGEPALRRQGKGSRVGCGKQESADSLCL